VKVKTFCFNTLLLVGVSSGAVCQHFEDGELIFPERRIDAFVYKGADEEVIRSTLPRIKTREGNEPGSWVYEWSYLGRYYESEGYRFAQDSQGENAKEAYMKASNYYAMAWFPFNYTPEEKAAYAKHLDAYEAAGRFFDEPLEIIEIPFKEGTVKVYMHKPYGIDQPPLVLWTQGADQYKANAYTSISALINKGIAVGTFDLLGFGENEQWVSTPESDELHLTLLDYFSQHEEFDTSRISFVGFSWGGYYTAKLATRNDPRIHSIVSFCGPIHEVFSMPEERIEFMLNSPEGPTIENLLRRLGARDRSAAAAQEVLAPFSLLSSGLIGQGETIKTPLLVANGTRDGLIPVSEAELLFSSAKRADLWLLGSGDHCANEYLPVALPQLADWILEQ
tara:strand:+ start:1774 stop:2952 length:1179 start_codon:yes stop_codon:yes gene_type:complete